MSLVRWFALWTIAVVLLAMAALWLAFYWASACTSLISSCSYDAGLVAGLTYVGIPILWTGGTLIAIIAWLLREDVGRAAALITISTVIVSGVFVWWVAFVDPHYGRLIGRLHLAGPFGLVGGTVPLEIWAAVALTTALVASSWSRKRREISTAQADP